MRGVTKLLLAAALALLLTAGLAACGGGDSDDSTASSTAATTEQAAPATSPEDSGSGTEEREPEQEKEPGSGEGGSSEGSASFRTPGGDNSIPDFGEEADAEERAAASKAVVGFTQARAAGDWDAVCSHMAAATLKPLERLSSLSQELNGKACPELLEAFMGQAPASSQVSTLSGSIDSLRLEGERGFALYHGTDGEDYFLPLVKEGGQWKVGALGPTAFPG